MDVDKMGWDGDKKKKLTISYIMVDLGSYLSHRFFYLYFLCKRKVKNLKQKRKAWSQQIFSCFITKCRYSFSKKYSIIGKIGSA